MKILKIIPYFEWSFGGPTRSVLELSQSLAKKGHEITIYTTDVGINGKLKDSERINDELVTINYFRCFNNWMAKNLKFHFSEEMRNEIKKNIKYFDVVHLHEWRGIPNIYACYYAQKYNIPYIMEAHGSSPKIIGRQTYNRNISKRVFDTLVGEKIINNSSKFIALTKSEMQDYENLSIDPKKITIIPNGINVNRFSQDNNNNNNNNNNGFKESYGIKGDVILYLGRINERKGIDFLIKSFNELLNEKKGIILVIVGPNDGYKTELERLVKKLKISENVKFFDYINDVSKVYNDSEILVYPAIQEIFGRVPFEAIISNVPVIVANDSGCGELVKEAKCGLLVEYGDIKDLKNKIKYLLENHIEGKILVDNGKKYINENMKWDKIAEKVEQIYLELYKKS